MMSAAAGPLTDRDVVAVFAALARTIEPRPELRFISPFELLVAVVLSAQATDKSVNAATAKLFAVANTPEALVKLGVSGLKPFIRTIGLFNTKAANLVALSGRIIADHGGRVPSTRAELESLPGVGPKTASVVLNVAFGVPTIAVDTHVHRVANRLGLARTARPEDTQRVLEARTPKRYLLHAHHYLILHGRYTCTARSPKCGVCVVRKWCAWPGKTE
jgi:endonuclease III